MNTAKTKYQNVFQLVSDIRINRVDHKNESFKELCLKFGNEELYRKILQQA